MKTFLIATVAVTATLVANPANAKGNSWQIGNDQFHIYFADLDTSSSAGRAAMLARVEKAAAKLCADRVDRDECVAATLDQAARAAGGAPLTLALSERDARHYAAR